MIEEDFSLLGGNRSSFNEKPVQYAMCLFLTGQFETAIDLLNQIEQFRCHAVHIGIYLHESRLLSTASKSDSPMCKFGLTYNPLSIHTFSDNHIDHRRSIKITKLSTIINKLYRKMSL